MGFSGIYKLISKYFVLVDKSISKDFQLENTRVSAQKQDQLEVQVVTKTCIFRRGRVG